MKSQTLSHVQERHHRQNLAKEEPKVFGQKRSVEVWLTS